MFESIKTSAYLGLHLFTHPLWDLRLDRLAVDGRLELTAGHGDSLGHLFGFVDAHLFGHFFAVSLDGCVADRMNQGWCAHFGCDVLALLLKGQSSLFNVLGVAHFLSL